MAMTTKQRIRHRERCGKQAFGDCCSAKAARAGHPRYPLTKPGTCRRDCRSVHDAFKRARQQHENRLAAEFRAIAERMGCLWAKS